MIDAYVRSLYGSYLKDVLSSMGLHPFIRHLYRRYLETKYSDQISISFQGVESVYRCHSAGEIIYLRDGIVEDKVLQDILSHVDGDDLIADIGAHIGLYSCFLQNKISEHGQVIAFEPNPVSYESLKANLALNDGAAEAHQFALSNENGTTDLSIPDQDISTESAIDNRSGNTVNVDTVTGDAFFAQRGMIPNIVKIDVEGAELKVLEGMKETLSHPECRIVYCEVHLVSLPRQGGTPSEVKNTLERFGFTCEMISKKEEKTYHLKGSKGDEHEKSKIRISTT